MTTANIRNFVIIAHIDHGKSTLADRFLETTGAVEKRKMRAQYLDQLELERERGITIKMAPVRMNYRLAGVDYMLNLIDTPGHSDFGYEVSRALEAVEGAILLVDATKGVQAQTLANFRAAKAAGLKIIGAVNKIDLFPDGLKDSRFEQVVRDTANLLKVGVEDIFLVSGRDGQGVEDLLAAVIKEIPSPKDLVSKSKFLISNSGISRALIFDSFYDEHKGVVASVRIFDGDFKANEKIALAATERFWEIKEIGYFGPEMRRSESLRVGEIGYLATGVKDLNEVKIGDTVLAGKLPAKDFKKMALPGYQEPKPVVFVSFFPDAADDYDKLKKCFQKLKLNDSALHIEPDQNEVLGRGLKVGFLGRLHFEIATERLKREFGLAVINTFPSVRYRVETNGGLIEIVKPEDLPEIYSVIWEPMTEVEVIMPGRYLNNFYPLQNLFRIKDIQVDNAGDSIKIFGKMPLAELISDFDDRLKSATEGYASFNYKLVDYEKTDVVKTDILVNNEIVPGLSRFLPKLRLEKEGRAMVERLKELLPRQQFTQPVQASAGSKIIARETIPAMRKDVTGYLYGGDRSRKMKLWKKQQRGKKNLLKRARVTVSADIFKELLKKEN